MAVDVTAIAAVMAAAHAMFPAASLTLRFGNQFEHSVSAIRGEPNQGNNEDDLSGNIAGLLGSVRIIKTACDPWVVPDDGDRILLETSAGVELGTYTVLNHADDQLDVTRKLFYGEESA